MHQYICGTSVVHNKPSVICRIVALHIYFGEIPLIGRLKLEDTTSAIQIISSL